MKSDSQTPRGSLPAAPVSAGPTWLPDQPGLRRATLMLMDAVLLAFGLAAIFLLWVNLREEGVPRRYASLFGHVVVPIVAMRLTVLHVMGLYRSIAGRTGVYELLLIAAGATLTSLTIGAANLILPLIPSLGSFPLAVGGENLLRLPWGVVVTEWMLSMITVGGVRLLRREIEQGLLRSRGAARRPVLIVGAGATGAQVAQQLAEGAAGTHRAVAFVDSDPALVGHRIMGLNVAGQLEDLPEVIERFEPEELVIALERPTPKVTSKIIEQCGAARLNFKIVPPLSSVMSGGIEFNMLRPVEIEDLLGREPVELAAEEKPDYLRGERVLITGAGGSIGRELCRQAIALGPAAIALYGHGENSLFEAEIELRPLARDAGVELETYVGDIRDERLIASIFERFGPRIVFHAAAHKHVHLMEVQPCEAVKNNVQGTLTVARAAQRAGVERFIFISTDKAVRPTGMMGASKRVAEMIVSSINLEAAGVFVSVRFGNVLGSRGSVIPMFRRQIAQGGPVTVTDPEVTRYFMTTSEAVSLVLQAGARGREGGAQEREGGAQEREGGAQEREGGELFVLDMGSPVKIVDLARNLITLSGLEPDEDIEITFTGMRPGEKMTEELLTKDEGTSATEHGKIFIARNEARPWIELGPEVEEMIGAARENDDAAVRRIAKRLVPDFGALNKDTQTEENS